MVILGGTEGGQVEHLADMPVAVFADLDLTFHRST